MTTDASEESTSNPEPNTNASRLGRRQFITGTAGAATLTGLAGCSDVLGSTGGNGETVTILLTPDNPTDVEEEYTPMKNYLEGEIDGLAVDLRVPTDYSAVRTALESEQAEIGLEDVGLISKPEIFDVMGTAVTGGTAFYFSMMLTQPDSGIEKRTDLKGKKVAFADRLSTSGSIFATYTLMEAGLDIGEAPDGDPVDFEGEWSNHDQALKDLKNGRADACCTWSGNGMESVAAEDIPQEVREEDAYVDEAGTEEPLVKPIWWSFPIPKQPFYARKSWESDMKDTIEEALHNANEQKMEPYVPDDYEGSLPFTTLEDTGLDHYEPVIERLDALDIELGN
ncbi:PhnD/SsuA/transferrin family substrate-binding protein (plasmid) [Natronorubrum aibiense]|uniref:PhnD/SsuA/transferrin family substrate-binding protein n=2 Tax=Natronorubrum aibiense TaxID=348826 RepID=A0A5P9P9R5_9EURY|nr:PhnD/SsuA/transferrin family substrate-binding protein [Natronorubrum aibiense]